RPRAWTWPTTAPGTSGSATWPSVASAAFAAGASWSSAGHHTSTPRPTDSVGRPCPEARVEIRSGRPLLCAGWPGGISVARLIPVPLTVSELLGQEEQMMSRTSIALAGAVLAMATAARAAAPPAPSQTGNVTVFKLNALVGSPFRTEANDKVGTLKDLVVDADGRIVYGVMAHGGVAGVGNKLFAVPPAVLQTLAPVAGSADTKEFTLRVDKATLDNTPGFDDKNYPTAPSPIFTNTGQDPKAAGEHAGPAAAAAGEVKLFR